jgi:hypothetical protein
LAGFIDKCTGSDDGLFAGACLRWPELFGPHVHGCFVVFFLTLRLFIIHFAKNLVVGIISSRFPTFLALDLLQLFSPMVGLIGDILAVSQWSGFRGGGVFEFQRG